MLFKTISLPVVFCVLLAVCCSKQPSESEGNTTIENSSGYTVQCTLVGFDIGTRDFSLASGASMSFDMGSSSVNLGVTFPDNTHFTKLLTHVGYYTITNSGINGG